MASKRGKVWLEPRGPRVVVRDDLRAKAAQQHMVLHERDPEARWCETHGRAWVRLNEQGYAECPVCLEDVYRQVIEDRWRREEELGYSIGPEALRRKGREM